MQLDAPTRLWTSQYRAGCKDLDHPLHDALHAPVAFSDRAIKRTALDSTYEACVHGCDREVEGSRERKPNVKTLPTDALQRFLASREDHLLLQAVPPEVHKSVAE